MNSLNPQVSPEVICVPIEIATVDGANVVQPVRFGVPLPRGTKVLSGEIVLRDGTKVTVQLETTCRWSDKSDQWVLVDALLPANVADGEAELLLSQAHDTNSIQSQVTTESINGCIQIQTNACEFQIDLLTLQPFSQVMINNEIILGKFRCLLLATDKEGIQWEAECVDWKVETKGGIRTALLGTGQFLKLNGLLAAVRISFFAGSSTCSLEVSIHNPNRAQHPGGLWDLGDSGSVLFQDFSLEFEIDELESLCISLDGGNSFEHMTGENWNLYQDSSGGEAWQSENHVNREGVVKNRFSGFVAKSGSNEIMGKRAEPVVELNSQHGSFALAFPEFWQQFPKAISASDGRLRLGLFPAEHDDLHEIQGGERKTHLFWVNFSSGAHSGAELIWVHQPARIRVLSQWVNELNLLHSFKMDASERRDDFENLLAESVYGEKGIFANRELVDEYGWRNFGEIFADHEEAFYHGEKRLISHFNNQYDMVYGFLLHYLRTGNEDFRILGDALARHVADIDIYHTQQDRAAYNGGLFWLTDHYVHANTATHRTYSKHNIPDNGIYGGGPGSEHNYTSGLMLHYELTGNQNSKNAVRELADWVLAMDNGSKNILGIINDSPTGIATGSETYQGPNRGGGNSINSLLDAWRLFENESYLHAAENLIRRCVHPRDRIENHKLLDVENRWSYTVFLTSLAKYLDLKSQADQLDGNYAYAQAALVHYAGWMLKNERPYFDQEEKLEFPTEAWAVQEFRKANVLRLAASHASPELSEKFWIRGQELADRAWIDLLRFETKTCVRSLAIIMVEGLKDGYYRGTSPVMAPRGADELYENFGSPVVFIPQKVQVKQQLKNPIGLTKAVVKLLNPSSWINYLKTDS